LYRKFILPWVIEIQHGFTGYVLSRFLGVQAWNARGVAGSGIACGAYCGFVVGLVLA
jgi:hypothetical protein